MWYTTCICIAAHLILMILVSLPFKLFFTFLLNRLQLVEASLGRCCLAPKSCWFGCQHRLNHFYRVAYSIMEHFLKCSLEVQNWCHINDVVSWFSVLLKSSQYNYALKENARKPNIHIRIIRVHIGLFQITWS